MLKSDGKRAKIIVAMGLVAIVLGVKVPAITVPITPGRNLAVIVETAAMNNRQKKMGYNAAKDLMISLGMDDVQPEDKEIEIWQS